MNERSWLSNSDVKLMFLVRVSVYKKKDMFIIKAAYIPYSPLSH